MPVLRNQPPSYANSTAADDAALDSLARDVLGEYLRSHPVDATFAGIHDFDGQLAEMTPEAADRRISELESALQRTAALREGDLSAPARLDLRLLEVQTSTELLAWREIRGYQRDPRLVNEEISWGLLLLLQRAFAPLEERAALVQRRLEAVPQALADSRRSLDNPPAIFTELALEEFEGALSFFTQTIPEAVASLGDDRVRSRVLDASRAAEEAYRTHLRWLWDDLRPRSHGSFALGPSLYHRYLRTSELVDISLPRLLEMGWLELRRLQEEFRRTAAALDPSADPGEVLERVMADHPPAEQLLEAARSTLADLRGFCVAADLLAMPDAPDPFVLETPSFARDLAFAMMDTPGPFEQVATEAYYYVTLPSPDWAPDQREGFLRMFSRPNLRVVGAHEVYPGHYAQLLRVREAPSLTRRVVGSGAFIEGWAHYCEEMMLEAGYGSGDPGLKLAQLHEALLRACRFLVGISLHCFDMTVEEATAFFQTEGYQPLPSAEREARRGTTDPFYLIYTLGKILIKELREDCRRAWGTSFTLRRFHDAMLSQGSMPVALHRASLLG